MPTDLTALSAELILDTFEVSLADASLRHQVAPLRAELLRRLRLEEARHPTHANVPLPSDLEPDPPADPES